MTTSHTALRWLPAAVWAVVIFALSSVPGSSLPGRYSYLGHVIEYGVLGATLAWALMPHRDRSRVIIAAVALASAYGITDEMHQAFVPMRTPDPRDWLVDTAAAAAGAALTYAVLSGRDPRSADADAGAEARDQ